MCVYVCFDCNPIARKFLLELVNDGKCYWLLVVIGSGSAFSISNGDGGGAALRLIWHFIMMG